MNNGHRVDTQRSREFSEGSGEVHGRNATAIHPAWRAFVDYCAEMRHGEIEKLKIQDGLPVLAEVATRKVKF